MAVNRLGGILRATSIPRDVRNFYTKDGTFEKDPFELFRTWYRDAGLGGNRCSKHMCLTTVSNGNIPKSRIIKCIEPTSKGFKFAVNAFTETRGNLLENENVSVQFLWPNKKAVRIEGMAKELPEEDTDEYIKGETYYNRIVSLCAKFNKLVSSRASLENLVKELEAKYSTTTEVPKHAFVYVLVPTRFEFDRYSRKLGKSRLKFEKGLKVDNKYVHPAKEEWTYSWLSC